VKRGEIWTIAGCGGYASKPRPVLIVQDDVFAERHSVTVCLLTTDTTVLPILRIPLQPSPDNGLRSTSQLMVDKLTTEPRTRLGQPVGCLEHDDLLRFNRELLVFLGLAR
jgi:mRNA interferase MazF